MTMENAALEQARDMAARYPDQTITIYVGPPRPHLNETKTVWYVRKESEGPPDDNGTTLYRTIKAHSDTGHTAEAGWNGAGRQPLK